MGGGGVRPGRMQPQVCCERRGPQAGSSLVCGAGAALGVQRLSRRQASPTTALLTRPNRPATKARPSPEAREREREGARAGRRGPGVVQHGVGGGGVRGCEGKAGGRRWWMRRAAWSRGAGWRLEHRWATGRRHGAARRHGGEEGVGVVGGQVEQSATSHRLFRDTSRHKQTARGLAEPRGSSAPPANQKSCMCARSAFCVLVVGSSFSRCRRAASARRSTITLAAAAHPGAGVCGAQVDFASRRSVPSVVAAAAAAAAAAAG